MIDPRQVALKRSCADVSETAKTELFSAALDVRQRRRLADRRPRNAPQSQ